MFQTGFVLSIGLVLQVLQDKKVCSRVRFLMQDVIELRLAGWKLGREVGPFTSSYSVVLSSTAPSPPPPPQPRSAPPPAPAPAHPPQEAGPRTIEQVHADFENEQLNAKLQELYFKNP